MVEDIDLTEAKINIAKFRADGEKYFSLFDKHIPTGLGSDCEVLLYKIGNMTVIKGIVDKNPTAKYVVYDRECVCRLTKIACPGVDVIGYASDVKSQDPYDIFEDKDMKFDLIIMNPPYANSLHLKILAAAIRHLKDEKSLCVNLSPVRWLQNPVAKYMKTSDFNRFEESVSKHIEQLNIITAVELAAIFNVPFWNDNAIYVCKATNEYRFYDNYVETLPSWPLIKKIGLPLYTGTLGVASVYDMYSKNTELPYWIKCSRVHGHVGKKDECECITPQYGLVFNKKGHEGREVYFATEVEARHFFEVMNTLFYKFLKILKCWPTGDFNKGLPWLGDTINPRTGLKGYLGEWTDEDLYAYFNITEDEKKLIEQTMEKYR